ncbi:hypothetical protein SAMN04488063_0799 [Halopelagius inordinatus]|uniref:RnhA operon protein n=1 Tax=Halopelagius inordinatus TaxID=553467 RepID=A0A1I2MRB1_9EURY|nr:rnhA operon protein [Halopelagius inordinatus]SFF92017.1 hypothetical protein SAMN04488063_0799 [Halopelagius inordinatus]
MREDDSAAEREDPPEDAVDEIERLTRLARGAADENERAAYEDRRETILDEFAFTPRVREDDETLVLYPTEWVEDGVVQIDRIDDVDRGIERPLRTDAGDEGEFAAVESHNSAIVDAVEDAHGPVHAANARVFADFMSNHYVRRIESASRKEVQEFLDEYYLRNAWPSEDQSSVVDESLELTFDVAGTDVPGF